MTYTQAWVEYAVMALCVCCWLVNIFGLFLGMVLYLVWVRAMYPMMMQVVKEVRDG